MLREDAVRERRPAMKEAAMSLSREAAMNAELRSSARRTCCACARREPCLAERSQQCQGGLGARKHDLHDQGEDRSSDAGEETLSGRVAPPGQRWTVLSFVYLRSTTTEGCYGTKLD